MTKPVLFVLGASALPLAHRLRAGLDGEVHVPKCVGGGDVTYDKATTHLALLFKSGRSIIGLCAAGILIRSLAPYLKDKQSEPAVVALAEDGTAVVPLLGGHHGANTLARRIAQLTGGQAALTTASEVRFGMALDEPADGFVLGNPEHMKAATAAMLNGASVALAGEQSPFPQAHLPTSQASFEGVTLQVTENRATGSESVLVYHPRNLVMGLGCERGASPEEMIELATSVLQKHNLSPRSLAAVASIDLKADEPAIHAVAAHFSVPARFFAKTELANETSRLATPSETVAREVGVPGVAEAAALALAGPQSTLLVPKALSRRATCAIARSPQPILTLAGQPRGILHVVGIGPGSAAWRSPAASAALIESQDWVGYSLYLDLVSDLRSSQQEHRFPLGAEEDRVKHAISLAQDGREVALVCSGDAGIYAMAALVFELLELSPATISVNVIPGISAFQAAAARAGAIIGHDFCCISLSDLLTPWETIESRIQAAAIGDFVTAFYNPRSLKRRDQIERAFTLLKPHRPPSTPVIIATSLGRPDERVRVLRFDAFDANDVDMLTLVMVGSSQTRAISRGDGQTYAYTPRGYARKRDNEP